MDGWMGVCIAIDFKTIEYLDKSHFSAMILSSAQLVHVIQVMEG